MDVQEIALPLTVCGCMVTIIGIAVWNSVRLPILTHLANTPDKLRKLKLSEDRRQGYKHDKRMEKRKREAIDKVKKALVKDGYYRIESDEELAKYFEAKGFHVEKRKGGTHWAQPKSDFWLVSLEHTDKELSDEIMK